MEDQQKLQQILAQLEVYKSQSELYQTQIDAVQTSLAEIKILESTLDDISGKDTVETLVPLGAGSFINAEIKNENKVILLKKLKLLLLSRKKNLKIPWINYLQIYNKSLIL